MNYTTIRERIYTKLLAVDGIGKVFRTEKYSADWPTFFERFKVPHPFDETVSVVNVAWISRVQSNETSSPPYGGRAEDLTLVAVGIPERWTVTVVYGYHDDEDVQATSEHAFQTLLDNIKEAFRTDDALGIPDVVLVSEPAVAGGIGLYTLGGVLCHRAVVELQIIQRYTW